MTGKQNGLWIRQQAVQRQEQRAYTAADVRQQRTQEKFSRQDTAGMQERQQKILHVRKQEKRLIPAAYAEQQRKKQ